MFFFFVFLLLVLFRFSVAQGQAYLLNGCSFTIQYEVVRGMTDFVPLSPGNTASITFPPVGSPGISIKVAIEDPSNITQFEISQSLLNQADTIWFDISNQNGNPFLGWGEQMVPSEPSAQCQPKVCSPFEDPCTIAYTQPGEGNFTEACPSSNDLYISTCVATAAMRSRRIRRNVNLYATEGYRY
jgi:hypothetical protein